MIFEAIHFIFFFLGGAIFGSFLHVIVDRLPKGESIVLGRSYCDNCKKTILWWDLIPIVSYLLLFGKCRFCHKHISFYYPLVEITAGMLFLLCALLATDMLVLAYSLVIVSTLLVIFFADLKYGIIPFAAVVPGALVAFLYHLFIAPAILPAILSGLGSLLFFLSIFVVTRGRGMGFGDVVYAGYMGLLLSYPAIIFGLYLSFLTGAVVSLILILSGRKRLRGDTIPFGPFLVFGTVVMFFYGNEVLQFVRQFAPIF